MTALMMSRVIGSARCPSYAAFADALGIAAAITGARIGFGPDVFDAWLNGESPLSFASRIAAGGGVDQTGLGRIAFGHLEVR